MLPAGGSGLGAAAEAHLYFQLCSMAGVRLLGLAGRCSACAPALEQTFIELSNAVQADTLPLAKTFAVRVFPYRAIS